MTLFLVAVLAGTSYLAGRATAEDGPRGTWLVLTIMAVWCGYQLVAGARP